MIRMTSLLGSFFSLLLASLPAAAQGIGIDFQGNDDYPDRMRVTAVAATTAGSNRIRMYAGCNAWVFGAQSRPFFCWSYGNNVDGRLVIDQMSFISVGNVVVYLADIPQTTSPDGTISSRKNWIMTTLGTYASTEFPIKVTLKIAPQHWYSLDRYGKLSSTCLATLRGDAGPTTDFDDVHYDLSQNLGTAKTGAPAQVGMLHLNLYATNKGSFPNMSYDGLPYAKVTFGGQMFLKMVSNDPNRESVTCVDVKLGALDTFGNRVNKTITLCPPAIADYPSQFITRLP